MKGIPRFNSYGQYASGNYGAHTLVFTVGGDEFFFSYDTLVAVDFSDCGLVCRENDWGKTTGKHLNWIQPDHSKRVDAETFKRILKEHGMEE